MPRIIPSSMAIEVVPRWMELAAAEVGGERRAVGAAAIVGRAGVAMLSPLSLYSRPAVHSDVASLVRAQHVALT